jgi:hypothetical protein
MTTAADMSLAPVARRTGELWSATVDELPQRAGERIEAAVTRLYRLYDVGGDGSPAPGRCLLGAGASARVADLIAFARAGGECPITERMLASLCADLFGLPGCSVVHWAALARLALERGHPVPRTHLAALAGVSVKLVHKEVAQGRLALAKARARDRGEPARDVTPESARAWLVSRGVEGIA